MITPSSSKTSSLCALEIHVAGKWSVATATGCHSCSGLYVANGACIHQWPTAPVPVLGQGPVALGAQAALQT